MLRYDSFSPATHARYWLHMHTSISLEVALVRDPGIASACRPLSKHSTDVMLNVCSGTQLMQAPSTYMCPSWQDVSLPHKWNTQSKLTEGLGTFRLHTIDMPLMSATQPPTWTWETSTCEITRILFAWQVNCGCPYVQSQVLGIP